MQFVYKPISGIYSSTVTSTTKALTVPSNAQKFVFQVESADIRVVFDKTDPVAGAGGGILYTTGTDYSLDGWDTLTGFRAIRESSSDARITGQFFTKE